MAAFTETKDITISHKVVQATSRQDFAISGVSADGTFKFLIVADSHGGGDFNKDTFINLFSQIVWREFLQKENFVDEILQKIRVLFQGKSVLRGLGTTLSICKIFPDKFCCYWAGDSSIKIYKNGSESWKTIDHDIYNEAEISRIKTSCPYFIRTSDAKDVRVLNSSLIEQIPSYYFWFRKDGKTEKFNMPHCLGHYQVSGEFMSSETILRNNPEDKYKVVAGSDGFWGMTCDTDIEFISSDENKSEQLVEFSKQRWLQKWQFKDANGKVWNDIKFPDHNVDDIAVACYVE